MYNSRYNDMQQKETIFLMFAQNNGSEKYLSVHDQFFKIMFI